MAANMLPILALGAGALFLMMKKKDGDGTTNGTGTNGTGTNGTGTNGTGTNGTGTNGTDGGTGNGNEASGPDIQKPGIYDLKVGQTYTVGTPEGETRVADDEPKVDFNNVYDPWDSSESYIASLDEEGGGFSFRPLKAGKFDVSVRVVYSVGFNPDTGMGYAYKNIDYVFMVT